ncbi:uncharacterized protein LOC135810609 [Sycon ciliatum]|uniref:uncharacterized protein LOC135810609 n=1 Tax=Sycon ciliatum TaxID=27933 RepID=UPI0031F7011F
MRRLYDATRNVSKPYHRIRLSPECHLDLFWWSHLLDGWNGKSFFLDLQETLASDILIETDASGAIGHGAVYGTHWFADTWSPQHTPLCITFKEQYPICIACATWGHQWCRKRIRFHTDNEAVAAVLKSGTSRCPNVMSLLRQLFFICAKGNFMVTARHIPGTTNILADALSRQDFKRFHSCHPTAAHMPTPKFGSSPVSAAASTFYPTQQQQAPQKHSTATVHVQSKGVNLPTAIATVAVQGNISDCRLLFDTSSTRTFIHELLAASVNAAVVGEDVLSVASFGSASRRTVTLPRVEYSPLCRDGSALPVTANVMPWICCPVVKSPIDIDQYPEVKNIQLADTIVTKREEVEIDLLIGTDFYFSIRGNGHIQLNNGLVLLNSKLGFVPAGPTDTETDDTASHIMLTDATTLPDPVFDLQRFWRLEDIGITDDISDPQTADDIALEHFRSSLQLINGRYMVSWPWKDSHTPQPNLPENYELAFGHLKSLVKRLQQTPQVLEKDHCTITEQLANGIIKEVNLDHQDGPIHYIPHHCVVHSGSTTTKSTTISNSNRQACDDVRRSIYVDNVVTGQSSVQDATAYYREAKDAFASATMNLHEWGTNDPDFRDALAPEDKSSCDVMKELGMSWDTNCDTLSTAKSTTNQYSVITKRDVLRSIAQFYDPMGLFSPVIMRAKILVQSIWKLHVDWDSPLPDALVDEWKDSLSDLSCASDVAIPRYIGPKIHVERVTYELHVFCDASQDGYGTAAYLCVRQVDGAYSSVDLIYSRTRVSPIKATSIPHLELLAALIGATIIKFLKKELLGAVHISATHLWSDSQCVLGWIRNTEKSYPVFIANRLKEIRADQSVCFNYIRTADNPADLPFRGASLATLTDSTAWWCGPEWLRDPPVHWPKDVIDAPSTVLFTAEGPAETETSSKPSPLSIDERKYTLFEKLARVTAYSIKFVKRCRQQTTCGTHLSAAEIDNAKHLWILTCSSNTLYTRG